MIREVHRNERAPRIGAELGRAAEAALHVAAAVALGPDDRSRIAAELRHGVLRVVLPRAERAQTRRIEVKSP